MADSFSTFLELRLPATGAYNNTWGVTLNSDVFTLIDTAVTGWDIINIGAATTYSLPPLVQGGASVSRNFSLLFAGTPAGAVVVTLPSNIEGKQYLVQNETGQPMTFKYASSTHTMTVLDGEKRLIWCDGSDVYGISASASDASSLGGIPAANWMRSSRTAAEVTAVTYPRNTANVTTDEPWFVATEAPTITLDCKFGNSQQLTLTGNRIMAAPTNVEDGARLSLLIYQDGTGSRTLTWNAVFWFENGLSPTLGTAPGSADRFECRYNAAANKWYCSHAGNLNAGGGTTLPLTISQNCQNWNLKAVIGTLGAAATINILVAKGVIIGTPDTATPAMDLSGLISGCTINLTNLGYIQGRGGRGAQGGGFFDFNNDGVGYTTYGPGPGENGGMAIKGPGSGSAFNITNANGFIWGGGGGGGGGGLSGTNAGSGDPNQGNSGGGGGGAGSGEQGIGGNVGGGVTTAGVVFRAGDGTRGGCGPNGVHGTGGAGTTHGAAIGAAGGDGGDWGAVGADGVANTTNPIHILPGTGGTAGKAIELSGGAATFVNGAGSPNVKGAVS